MNIVGSIRKEEKEEILDVAKVFIVATRSRSLGKIARKTQSIDEAIREILGSGQNGKTKQQK